MCKLTDRRGLAHAVHADNEDHCGAVVRHKRPRRPDLIRNDPCKRGLCLGTIRDLSFLYIGAELSQKLFGRIHAHIGKDHPLLQLLKKLLVHPLFRGEQRSEHIAAGLLQTRFQLFKNALLLFHL